MFRLGFIVKGLFALKMFILFLCNTQLCFHCFTAVNTCNTRWIYPQLKIVPQRAFIPTDGAEMGVLLVLVFFCEVCLNWSELRAAHRGSDFLRSL